jgi:hypothetical protein
MNFRKRFFDSTDDELLRRADKLAIELWRLRDGTLMTSFRLEGSGSISPHGDGKDDVNAEWAVSDAGEGRVDAAFLRNLLDRFERREGGVD